LRTPPLRLSGGNPRHRAGVLPGEERRSRNRQHVPPSAQTQRAARLLLDFIAELELVRDPGDLTIARLRMHGHGVGSNAPMAQTLWPVAEWRHGKVIWWCFVHSEAEALEAAGLRE
jgi:hypothetical protein